MKLVASICCMALKFDVGSSWTSSGFKEGGGLLGGGGGGLSSAISYYYTDSLSIALHPTRVT